MSDTNQWELPQGRPDSELTLEELHAKYLDGPSNQPDPFEDLGGRVHVPLLDVVEIDPVSRVPLNVRQAIDRYRANGLAPLGDGYRRGSTGYFLSQRARQ